MSVVKFPESPAKTKPGANAIAHVSDRNYLEWLYHGGMVAVILKSGGDVMSAHRDYDAAFAAVLEADPSDPVQYSCADLHEILYGEEPD